MREISMRHRVSVHAYCLMTNHVHLLLTPDASDGCAAFMRDLGQRYVQYFNRTHQRTGTLWEGRFRSCPVESSQYVLACYRYIELNPVRAGMVDQPIAYQWSSHGANIGTRPDSTLSPHPDLCALDTEGRWRVSYARMFVDPLDERAIAEIRHATNGNLPLGSASLKAQLLAKGHRISHGRSGRPSSGSADDQPEIGL
jgi:putative transposase